MLVSVFGDESSDETRERVFAVAVLFAPEYDWERLEQKWIARTDGRVFHAAECETEFATHPNDQKHRDNLKLYSDLTTILSTNRVAGYGVALDLAAFDKRMPDVPRDSGYYRCFWEVVSTVLLYTARFNEIPPKGRITSLTFTFDHRHESEYNAGKLYDLFVNSPGWQKVGNAFLDAEVSFGSRKNPRIQMADLLARETMKEMDNKIGPVKRRRRKSMSALLSTKRMKFLMFGDSLLQEIQRQLAALDPEDPIFPDASRKRHAEYKAWLSECGLVDNWSNRFRHVALIQIKMNQTEEKE